MSEAIINGTVILKGVEVAILSEVEVIYEDNSFDHEFGTEHCGQNVVDTIGPVELDGSLRWSIEAELASRGTWTKRNRRYKKFIRQLERTITRLVAALDPDSFWGDKALNELAAGVDTFE